MCVTTNILPHCEPVKSCREALRGLSLLCGTGIPNARPFLLEHREVLEQLNFYIEKNYVNPNTIKEFWQWQEFFEKNRNYSLKKELPELFDKIKKI